jgi:aminocarboxymuconate-semialdehyde decarboxylase
MIDAHAHVFPQISRAQGRALTGAGEPWLRIHADGSGMMMSGDDEYRPVGAALWDPHRRLAEMDEHGVDVQAVSSTPLLFGYAAPADAAADWCDLVNDLIADHCAQAPERLWPLCQVPLQDPALAVQILDKAIDAGHRGVHLGNHIGNRDLSDEAILEFLRYCAQRDVPVLVHPWDAFGAGRMRRHMLAWLVGMPAETHLSILGLILSGGFDRLPASLRLCFCHGGGSFAYLLGRADNAWHNRDIVRGDSLAPPSDYLRRFHVDSAVLDPRAFRLLIDVMGADRVLLGTDFPFPLGERDPGRVVRDCTTLTETERAAVLSGNALAFFGEATRRETKR